MKEEPMVEIKLEIEPVAMPPPVQSFTFESNYSDPSYDLTLASEVSMPRIKLEMASYLDELDGTNEEKPSLNQDSQSTVIKDSSKFQPACKEELNEEMITCSEVNTNEGEATTCDSKKTGNKHFRCDYSGSEKSAFEKHTSKHTGEKQF